MICAAYGDPLPSITWNRAGSVLNSSSGVTIYEKVVTEGGLNFAKSILRICGAVVSDTDEYNCTANNTVRTESISFKLAVQATKGILPLF